MTAPVQENQVENKPNDKELNFRRLEEKYERKLAEAEQRAANAERMAQEALNKKPVEDDEDDSEPYVDHKRLNKKLSKFGQTTQSEIQKAMETAKIAAKEELKQELWLEQHPDFYDTMQKHAERFAEKAPELAKNILRMPEGFERQKLVYHNIKTLGIDQPEKKEPSVQQKIDANRKSPYYQPSGVSASPYSTGGDFSPAGQKNAYQKLLELKKNLRI